MLDFPIIKTDRLILRFLAESDIPSLFRYYQDNEARFAPTHPKKEPDFYTEKYWTTQIEKTCSDFKSGKSVRLFLFHLNKENEIIGNINLNEIVRGAFQACYLGYDISGKYEGQGLITEGVQAVIHYAFTTLNLHRLMANYQPYNIRSGNVLKRLGFVIEGTAKDYLRINGDWKDHVLTSLTNVQWKAQPEQEAW